MTASSKRVWRRIPIAISERLYDILVRLYKPGPAVAAFGAADMGAGSMVGLNVYFYGDQAAATAARETPLWQAWTQEHFPMPSAADQSS